jgi:hypothetical protein
MNGFCADPQSSWKYKNCIKIVFFVKRFTKQSDCGGSLFTSQGRAAKAGLELLSKAANVNTA